MRYMIFEEGDIQFIWDKKDAQLYRKDERGIDKVPGSAQQLLKSRPIVLLKEETDERPDDI